MKVCVTCGTEYADDQKFCPNDGSALRSTAEGDLIGSVIAERYHISKKIGEGGMGAVYLGEHVKMGRKSAIKVMSQSMANDPEAIARFNREAANAARINHPNVCAIYDFGETADGVIYLAMEFIEGEALTDVIRREGVMPPDRASTILRQTADALHAAHELGIVHRDLKPDNIMIARGRNGADVVKVVDFGIAKAMGGEEGQNVTKTGLVVGTPEYMSPEQLSGDQLDGRSDIYSLALVYYRMLTGVLPFQADSAQETMIKRLTDDPLPLNDAREGITYPAALQQVMDRALARMPGERYENAAQFADEAGTAAAQLVDAPAVPDAEGATQMMDTDDLTAEMAQTRVAGQPVTQAAATEPIAAPPTPTPTTPQPAPPPVAPAKKKLPVAAIAAGVVVLAGVGVGTAVMTGGGGGPSDTTTVATNDSGVTRDTARGTRGKTLSTTDTARGQRTNGQQAGDTGRGAVTPAESTGAVIPPVAGIQIDPAAAFTRLDDMLLRLEESNAVGVRDTARAFFDHSAVPRRDRAFAAYVIASAYGMQGDTDQAIAWGDSAVRLDPSTQAYQTFVTRLRGGGP